MKLLTKTSLLYLLVSLLVFAAGGLIFQHGLKDIFKEESDEMLQHEKKQVLDFIDEHKALPKNELAVGNRISFSGAAGNFAEKTQDTLIYIETEDEKHPYRQLTFPAQVNGVYFAVSIFSPMLEQEDLSETIINAFLYITLILLIAVLSLTVLLSRRIWKPFFKTIERLRNYNVNSREKLFFEKTRTPEFNELQEALSKMIDKISLDYQNLKSFTENASHEIRTPIAIIQSSAEILLQGENLTEQQHEELDRMLSTIQRLNRLNQALLLLAKIENRQFDNSLETDLGALVRKKEVHFKEILEHKSITLLSIVPEHVFVKIHPTLADILVSNLLTNAARHSPEKGDILVELTPGRLQVCNSGTAPIASPEKLFERFYKENPSSESTGLGLAIVKQITESAGMQIRYSFVENRHCFTVSF